MMLFTAVRTNHVLPMAGGGIKWTAVVLSIGVSGVEE